MWSVGKINKLTLFAGSEVFKSKWFQSLIIHFFIHVSEFYLQDPEVPLFLLRNVCFFCDSNGIGALKQCFDKATPDTLPFTFAHILITLIANVRTVNNKFLIPLSNKWIFKYFITEKVIFNQLRIFFQWLEYGHC